ncbi:hypothetical protein D3C78_1646600 [compost metagenome]
MFEAFGKFQWIDHGIKGSSAHWVKADKPLHRDFPASGVFHVVGAGPFQRDVTQSPLKPIWFDSGRERSTLPVTLHGLEQRLSTGCCGFMDTLH